jgi:RecB family exonuclease
MVDNQQSNTRFRRDAYAFCALTIENLRRLNFEQKANEVQTRTRLDELIDKQTTDYLKSLDRKTRSQLSKTQLVKSHQKVHQWKQKNRFDSHFINIFLMFTYFILYFAHLACGSEFFVRNSGKENNFFH